MDQTPEVVESLPQRPRPPLAKVSCPVDGCGKRVCDIHIHLKNCHPQFPRFTCGECPKRFRTNDERRDHAAAAHIKAERTTWACPVEGCSMLYSTKSGYASLNTHLRHKHPDFKRVKCRAKKCALVFESEEAMVAHHLADHDAILCRFSGCSEVFLDRNREKNHAQVAHMNLALQCPVQGCIKVFRSDFYKNDHVRKKHPGAMIYACAYHGCKESFNTREKRSDHQQEAHSRLPFPCPDPNCDEDFASERASIQHQRLVHLNLGIKCKHDGCDKVLTSSSGMRQHVLNYHEMQDLPCPHCYRTFFAKGNLNHHIKHIHETDKLDTIECPAEGCNYRSKHSQTVKRHINGKHPGADFNNVACPLATGELCDKTFPSQFAASRHANAEHRGKWPCPYAGHIDCNKKFDTKEVAYWHGSRTHDLYLCSVPNCVFAISQRWICYTGIWLHIKRHQEFLHFEDSEPPEPKKVVPGAPEWQAKFREAKDEDLPEDDEDLTEDDVNFDEHAPEGKCDDDWSQDLEDLERDEEALLGLELFRKRLDTVKQLESKNTDAVASELRIRNELLLRDFPPRKPHPTLGLKCIGPSRAHNYLIDKLCPQDAVLTLDNVKAGTFFDRKGKRRSNIGKRCFHCFAEYDFDQQVERHGILAGDDETSCSWTQCFKPLYRGSKFCETHLYQWKPREVQHDRKRMVELQLRMRPVLESA